MNDPFIEAELSGILGRPLRLSPYVVINGQHCDRPTWLEADEDPDSPSGGRSAGDQPPAYLTDLNLAFEAYLKFQAKTGWTLQYLRHDTDMPNPHWAIELRRHFEYIPAQETGAGSHHPARALCLAILNAARRDATS